MRPRRVLDQRRKLPASGAPRMRGHAFRFRVKLRGDSRFPYALGYSKTVLVRVR